MSAFRSADNEVVKLRQEVEELRRYTERLEARLDVVADQVEQRRKAAGHRDPIDLPTLEKWVVRWFGDTLERRVSNTRRWCPQWYNHPEVVNRLWIIYCAYQESLQFDDATSMSSWFVDHLDKHLEVILSADGPFAGCSPQRHTPARAFEVRQVFNNLPAAQMPPARNTTADNSPTQQQPALSPSPPRR